MPFSHRKIHRASMSAPEPGCIAPFYDPELQRWMQMDEDGTVSPFADAPEVVTLERLGLSGRQDRDSTDRLQAIIEKCYAERIMAVGNRRMSLKVSAQITLYNGMWIDLRATVRPDLAARFGEGETAGAVFRLVGPKAPYYDNTLLGGMFRNIRLHGPQWNSGENGYNWGNTQPIDGMIVLSTDAAGVQRNLFDRLEIIGFRENLILKGRNNFIQSFHNFISLGAWKCGLRLSLGNGSGEAIKFYGPLIANNHNRVDSTGGAGPSDQYKAVGIAIDDQGGNPDTDAYVFGGSIDYNDRAIDMCGGALSLLGVHCEDSSMQPFATLRYAPGKYYPRLVMTGGELMVGPLGYSGNADTGRAELIRCDATGGHYHVALDNVQLKGIKPGTLVVNVTDGKEGPGHRVSVLMDRLPGAVPRLCNLGQVGNGYFSNMDKNVAPIKVPGWYFGVGRREYAFTPTAGQSVSGLQAAWTIDFSSDSLAPGQSNAIRAVATCPSNDTLNANMVSVFANDTVAVRILAKIDSVTGGSIGVQMRCFAVDGELLGGGERTVGATLSAVTTGEVNGYVQISDIVAVPNRTAYVQLALMHFDFVGTMHWGMGEWWPILSAR
jgi:hypothetical protein